MSRKLRTAEDVCVEYAIAVAEVRRLTNIIRPGECTEMATSGWVHGNITTPVDPCISQLFSIKREGNTEEFYQEAIYEAEEALCERCRISLDAVRERKEARKRFGVAKRAVEAVGKRMKAVTA